MWNSSQIKNPMSYTGKKAIISYQYPFYMAINRIDNILKINNELDLSRISVYLSFSLWSTFYVSRLIMNSFSIIY